MEGEDGDAVGTTSTTESSTTDNEQHSILIREVGATDLGKKDFILQYKCNPYCRVKLINTRGTVTKEEVLPVQKKTKNPRWRDLNWRWTVEGNEVLQFTLLDSHRFMKDRELGVVNVSVETMVTNTGRAPVELPINGSAQGTLVLHVGNRGAADRVEDNLNARLRLPTGWEAREDTNGRIFYVDHITRNTQWERPNEEDEGERRRFEMRNTAASRRYYEERARAVEVEGNDEIGGEIEALDDAMTRHFMGNDEDSLPEGWAMQVAPNGRTFFIDHTTRRTTWDDPRLLSTSISDLPLPEGWEQRLSPDGKVFFVDHSTKKTTWEDPRFSSSRVQRSHANYSIEFKRKVEFFRSKLPRPTTNGKCEITVHRDAILEDSFTYIMNKTPEELRYKLWIELVGERALDYGGVSREWCFLLSRHLFNPYYGLFEYSALDEYALQPNAHSETANPQHLEYFLFVGRVIGIALYHGKLLDATFIRPFYKAILGLKLDLADVESVDSSFHSSLLFIRDNDPSELELYFSIEEDVWGEKKMVELVEGGKDKLVTEENKKEYIQALIDWKYSKRIHAQMEQILSGIFQVVPSPILRIFDANQLELLLCGLQTIDVSDWRTHTAYKSGYTSNHVVIHHFWQCVLSLSNDMRARLIQFVTGTSRVPMNGFRELYGSNGPQKFTIEQWGKEEDLPRAHTCFNRLDLPPYSSYSLLKKKLLLALDNSEYFSGVD